MVKICYHHDIRLLLKWFLLLGHETISDEKMRVAHEEMQDLKGVWTELSKIWEQIDDLKDKPWLSVAPRKVNYFIKTNISFFFSF